MTLTSAAAADAAAQATHVPFADTAATAVTATAGTTAVLHRLLDSSLLLPPEYAGGLTSHLPMALHALQQLGASAAQLQAFHDGYLPRFNGLRAAPAPAAAPPLDDAWLAFRGQANGHAVLHATFTAMLAADGSGAVLRRVLPALMEGEGVVAAALHGLIRTAHAVEAGHRGELATALAYWAWRWQPLLPAQTPAPAGAGEALDFDAWAAALVAAAPLAGLQGTLISSRMRQARQSPAYRALAGALQPSPPELLLRRLAVFAAERHLATRDFTVLHIVTGLRALRVLLPWLDGPAALMPVVVRTVAAAYLAARLAPVAAAAATSLPWAEIASRAIASGDDHVIKLVHACRDEAAAYGDGPWHKVAAAATL